MKDFGESERTMPVIGNHTKAVKASTTPTEVSLAVILTYERPGLLTATIDSLRAASPDLRFVIYDDGSESQEKKDELKAIWERGGISVSEEPHRGLIRSWVKIFGDFVSWSFKPTDGIVLLEDDLLFAKGWDDTLLKMAQGTAALGLKPGAMTCLRCHETPQSQVLNLNGVEAYQSMQHGFQVNLIPAYVFNKHWFYEEAAKNAEAGRHGIDVWFVGGLSHRLGLTSMMSCESLVAHVGAGNSIAGKQGFESFNGMGYNLPPELLREAALATSAIQD